MSDEEKPKTEGEFENRPGDKFSTSNEDNDNKDNTRFGSDDGLNRDIQNTHGEEEDEEEDEDEDEEDEDDEDEEEVGARKKRRTNQFIDMEAEVDSEEEEEEEEDDEEAELLRQTFIADDRVEAHDGTVVNDTADDRLHRQFDRRREREEEKDAEQLAEEYKQRYRKSHSTNFQGVSNVSQRFLLPSVNDPSIWGVRCRPGKEKELVRQLLKKKLTLKSSKNPLEIYSVLQRDNLKGYIYIEARKIEAVEHALQGMVNVFTRNKTLLPVEDYPSLLKQVKSTDVEIVHGIYIRIKRGKYQGDLALVDDLSENGLEVRCKVVPRLDYGKDLDDNGKRKRFSAKSRPPPKLFSYKEADAHDRENLSTRSTNFYVYKGDEYIDGYLYKDFKIQFIQTEDVKPTLEELTRFNNQSEEGIDLTTIAQSLKATTSKSTAFQPGDRVEVISGEIAGTIGKVLISNPDIVTIASGSTRSEVPVRNLRKIFSTGDHVRVISGRHSDETGLVVNIKGDHVTLLSDQSKQDITVFANSLVKSTDGASAAKVGKYELHDLIQLNSSLIGVIIKAEKGLFQILSQSGRIVETPPTAVSSKLQLSRNESIATDRNGNELKIGDSVKEMGGERREGTIIHIYKRAIFIKSKTITENLGIFVTNSLNVTTISSKDSIVSSNLGPDLNKLNPNIKKMSPMAPVVTPRVGGRDKTLNQKVTINSGGHKGLQGIVKDANGDQARVELHTKNKIISIKKERLSFYNNSGKLIPYLEFINERGFRQTNTGLSIPSSSSAPAGGRTPAWSSGGKTPAWGSQTPAWGIGGKTPAWGSQTPAWGAGSKTPAANNGSKTPSWGGNRSTWGGDGNRSAWGGDGNRSTWGGDGNKSTWGGGNDGNRSAWGGNDGNKSTWGGSKSRSYVSEAAPTPGGGWEAPTPGGYGHAAETPGGFDDDGYETP